jgi:hypothetical protein
VQLLVLVALLLVQALAVVLTVELLERLSGLTARSGAPGRRSGPTRRPYDALVGPYRTIRRPRTSVPADKAAVRRAYDDGPRP